MRQIQNTQHYTESKYKLTIKVTESITKMFKSSMMKGSIIFNVEQINWKFVPDKANTHKVRVSSSIDC